MPRSAPAHRTATPREPACRACGWGCFIVSLDREHAAQHALVPAFERATAEGWVLLAGAARTALVAAVPATRPADLGRALAELDRARYAGPRVRLLGPWTLGRAEDAARAVEGRRVPRDPRYPAQFPPAEVAALPLAVRLLFMGLHGATRVRAGGLLASVEEAYLSASFGPPLPPWREEYAETGAHPEWWARCASGQAPPDERGSPTRRG